MLVALAMAISANRASVYSLSHQSMSKLGALHGSGWQPREIAYGEDVGRVPQAITAP
jgi:hypothetical protein